MTNERATFIFTYYEIQFSIIRFSLVNDTEASIFGFYPAYYSSSTVEKFWFSEKVDEPDLCMSCIARRIRWETSFHLEVETLSQLGFLNIWSFVVFNSNNVIFFSSYSQWYFSDLQKSEIYRNNWKHIFYKKKSNFTKCPKWLI